MERRLVVAGSAKGADTIDVAAATQAGIIVTNDPTYCIAEVSEHALAR